ncbi:RloB family protein [Nostoc sp. CALU 546]|uniref:RloB family protein n=1 Tax=Nostoc sp. CALU 546 TaxID=1867241 RepID=UPI003B67428C
MAKTKANSRGYSPRKVNTRDVKQRFLIVCEGAKTEPNYFRSFRVPKNVVEIDVQGLGENPSKLVQSAKELNKQEGYDQVWCVFDRDSWTTEDFNNAIKNAENLLKRYNPHIPAKDNPSTTVHLLVQELNKFIL